MPENLRDIFFFLNRKHLPVIFAPQDPAAISINNSLISNREADRIDKVLQNSIPGSSIATLNDVTDQLDYRNKLLGQVKGYVFNYVTSARLQKRLRYAAGVGRGFYNALVAAEAISLADGLELIQAEADCVDKAGKPNLKYTPAFRPFLGALEKSLSTIRITKAKKWIVSPINDDLIRTPEQISQAVLDQTCHPINAEVIEQSLKAKGLTKPVWIGQRVFYTAQEHPQKTVLIAAVAAGVILGVYELKSRQKRPKTT